MPSSRSLLFERWPRFAARHPWRVLAGTAVALGLVVSLYAVGAGSYASQFTIPGAESQRLTDLLEERFAGSAGDSATVVVRAPGGVEAPDARVRVDALVASLRALPDVVAVSSPYEQPAAVSPDGRTARINVLYSKQAFDVSQSSVESLLDVRKQYTSPELQVEVGGQIVHVAERELPGRTELIGISVAAIILLVSFGSVVAMGLPIVIALLGIGAGLLLVGVGASFLDLPAFTSQFSAMIGLGAGIDYALLIVTRFREGLARRLSIEEAIIDASATAGRSVLFAGSTVVVALLGLWAVGIPLNAYVGTAAALVVALTVVVALLVLPAVLALTGTHIERWRLPLPASAPSDSETGAGYRLSRLIQRAPVAALAASLAVLLLLAMPTLWMRLGIADDGNNPESFTSRRAYDLLAQGFGPGSNGPILVGVRIDDAGALPAVDRLPDALRRMDGVAGVSPVAYNDDRSAAIVSIIPGTSPQSDETDELVHRLRKELPAMLSDSGAEAFAGGPTAMFIDAGDKIRSRLPVFFAAVIGLSFVLLMVVFRSVLVPLKAAAMNLLSIGAAYGVLVAVFQWGWLGGLLGIHREGPIESFMPMFLFAVLFGLSMDYEVFLISRIREEYLRSGDNAEAVAKGLSVTTRVISAAAAIMIAVFLSFGLSEQRVIKEFGLGLATAIFVDATLVRLVLVPSLMQLMGDANWWFPPWLDRVIPKLSVDASAEPAESVGVAGIGVAE